jgi:hypothetical protein
VTRRQQRRAIAALFAGLVGARALLGCRVVRFLAVTLVLLGCSHSSQTTDAAVGEAVFRTISYAVTSEPHARPSTVGVSLKGQVVVVKPLEGPTPVPYAEVALRHDGRTIATTASDREGRFQFRGSLPEESYDLVLTPGDYEGSLTVRMKGTPDVFLFVEPVSTASH